jgi:hypothetical protein
MHTVLDLSPEWRETIARNWQRMLPHMRRGLERTQQRLDAESDPDARRMLAGEIARRRERINAAEAAIVAASHCSKGEDAPAHARVAGDILVRGLNVVVQPMDAHGPTTTPLQSHPRSQTMSMARLLMRFVARTADPCAR